MNQTLQQRWLGIKSALDLAHEAYLQNGLAYCKNCGMHNPIDSEAFVLPDLKKIGQDVEALLHEACDMNWGKYKMKDVTKK